MAPKETRLDDSADIYKKREQQTERQKMSEMNVTEKWAYFKLYYFKRLIFTVIAMGFVTWMLVEILTPKPELKLSVVMANYPLEDEILDVIKAELIEYLAIDTENEQMLLDTTYDLYNNDLGSVQKLSTYVAVGEIDIFIAPESQFLKYAFSGAMSPLTDALPTDLYSALSDRLYTCKVRLDDEQFPQDAEGPEGVYGIYADELALFDQFERYEEPPVIGIIISGKNKENSVDFIRYLFDLK